MNPNDIGNSFVTEACRAALDEALKEHPDVLDRWHEIWATGVSLARRGEIYSEEELEERGESKEDFFAWRGMLHGRRKKDDGYFGVSFRIDYAKPTPELVKDKMQFSLLQLDQAYSFCECVPGKPCELHKDGTAHPHQPHKGGQDGKVPQEASSD